MSRLNSLIPARSGAHPLFGVFSPNKKPCKSLTYKALCYEGEGARTLNLRIDSPML